MWCLPKVAQEQELRPEGPLAMFPASPTLKEALEKVRTSQNSLNHLPPLQSGIS